MSRHIDQYMSRTQKGIDKNTRDAKTNSWLTGQLPKTVKSEVPTFALPGLTTRKPLNATDIHTRVLGTLKHHQELIKTVNYNSGGQLNARCTAEYQIGHIQRRCSILSADLHRLEPTQSGHNQEFKKNAWRILSQVQHLETVHKAKRSGPLTCECHEQYPGGNNRLPRRHQDDAALGMTWLVNASGNRSPVRGRSQMDIHGKASICTAWNIDTFKKWLPSRKHTNGWTRLDLKTAWKR